MYVIGVEVGVGGTGVRVGVGGIGVGVRVAVAVGAAAGGGGALVGGGWVGAGAEVGAGAVVGWTAGCVASGDGLAAAVEVWPADGEAAAGAVADLLAAVALAPGDDFVAVGDADPDPALSALSSDANAKQNPATIAATIATATSIAICRQRLSKPAQPGGPPAASGTAEPQASQKTDPRRSGAPQVGQPRPGGG